MLNLERYVANEIIESFTVDNLVDVLKKAEEVLV